MNEQEIADALKPYVRKNRMELLLTNMYFDSFEMDVAQIKRSKYLYEYEIKCSYEDYKLDFEKKKVGWGNVKNKHEEIESGERLCNRFFFVLPVDIIDKIGEVPIYCGLITYDGKWFEMEKNAPLLHRRKFDKWEKLAKKLYFKCQRNT